MIRTGLCTVVLWLIAGAVPVHAQGTPLERFVLAVRADDAFHTARLDRFGYGRLGLVIAGDYGWNPLILDVFPGSDLRVVERQLSLQGNLSVSVADRVIFFAGLRSSAVMDGEPVREAFRDQADDADGAGLGDTQVGARVLLLGEPDDLFALGAQVAMIIPTAELADDAQRYQGETAVALTPALILELRRKTVRVSANLGAHIRENAELIGTTFGDEFRYSLAVGVRPVPAIEVLAEGFGTLGLQDFGERENSALDWLLGAKLYHPAGFTAGLAGGTGLRPALGSPDARVVLMLGWLSEGGKKKAAPRPAEVPLDADFDGVPDVYDACKWEPEDRDGFDDDNGCPDPDNDNDGVLDAADLCGNEVEDRDGFHDDDGCPDPDNDGDGILDEQDKCPNEGEDVDQFQDEDGCPDPDNDNDGVLDGADECPFDSGSRANNGCPRAIRVEEGSIRLLQQINFANNSDVILSDSTPIMVEIRDALVTHAKIRRVRIEGHTDQRGADKRNLELSKRRVASVSRWLIEQGTSPDRLEAWGCGEVQPIETNATAEGRAKNRRVAFQIIDPVPSGGVQLAAAGCDPASATGVSAPKPTAAVKPAAAKPVAPGAPAATAPVAPPAPASAAPAPAGR